jgi:ABC-2 type transport system permease protein
LLQMPVSLNGAFLINYLGSIVSPGVSLVLAAMFGLSLGLFFSRGVNMLVLFPLVGAFVLMVTSIAYQFRGWLAALMVNKRRRRTIATIAGLAFLVITQLPNLVMQPWRTRQPPQVRAQMQKEIEKLDQALAAHQIDRSEYRRQSQAVRNKYSRLNPTSWKFEDVRRAATTVNLAVPLGWLPYGVMRLAENDVLPSLLGALGLSLIAAASLRRSYVTTLRLYRGEFASTGPARKQHDAQMAVRIDASRPRLLLEKRLPWIGEQASAVALASFRSLSRAPEARMLFLTPVIMVVIFGSMIFRGNTNPPVFVRPLMATGGIGLILLILSQLAGNQFGFDRNGFRSYVLSPVERRNVLIGKNLALAPFALGLTLSVVVIFDFAYPMRIDHFIATLVQTAPMFFLYCMFENLLSILAPMPVAPGSMKPYKPKGVQILMQLIFFLMFPIVLSPILIPLGIELALNWSGWSFPAYLVFGLLECAAVAALYPLVMRWQGDLLQQRERRILEVVTSKIE